MTPHLRPYRLTQLVPAEDIQRDPVSVIRSIPLGKIATAFIIATALAFVAGGMMAIGGNS